MYVLVCCCVVDDRYKRPVAASLRPDTQTTTQSRDLPQHTSSSSSSETVGDVAVMRQAEQLTTERARDELYITWPRWRHNDIRWNSRVTYSLTVAYCSRLQENPQRCGVWISSLTDFNPQRFAVPVKWTISVRQEQMTYRIHISGRD